MKLTELAQNDWVKACIVGSSGVGKTCLAAQFPKPLVLFDFDQKADSITSWHKDAPWLDQIEVHQLGASLLEDPIVKFQKEMKKFEANAKKGDLPATVVIDSLTTFSMACLKHVVKTNPGVKRPVYAQGPQPTPGDYGILGREFARLIPGMLALPCNVVMIGHLDEKKDEDTGSMVRTVMMDGGFAAKLPIFFPEVYMAHVRRDGSRYLQTQPDYKYQICRTQRGLDKEIELTYEAIKGVK